MGGPDTSAESIEQRHAFRSEQAQHYAQTIARPRFVGTSAEGEVREYLIHQLAKFGYQVETEPFQFTVAVNQVVVVGMAAQVSLAALALLSAPLSPYAPLFFSSLAVWLLANFNRLLRWAEARALQPTLRQTEIYTAQNIIAHLPGADQDSTRPHLIVMAHYDSKSQRMPIAIRLALLIGLIGGSVGLLGASLANLFTPTARPVMLIAGLTVLAAGLPLAGMDWANQSPGAVDNASGVGLALHLAEWLAAQPPTALPFRWSILLTTAEELALMGAAAYVDCHLPALQQQAGAGGLLILNLDGIGVEGSLYLDAREQTQPGQLAQQLARAAYLQGIALRPFQLPGVLFDHMPFARRGLDAVTLLAIGRATWHVHTPRDTVDRLHPCGFQQAGQVIIQLIQSLAQPKP